MDRNKTATIATVAGIGLSYFVCVYGLGAYKGFLRPQSRAAVENNTKTDLPKPVQLPKSPAELVILSHSNDVNDRIRAVDLTNSPELLRRMSSDPDCMVRYGVVDNRNTPDDVLIRMSRDKNGAVGFGAEHVLEERLVAKEKESSTNKIDAASGK